MVRALLAQSLMVHSCIPALGKLRQDDLEFQANLNYIGRLSQKTKQKKSALCQMLLKVLYIKGWRHRDLKAMPRRSCSSIHLTDASVTCPKVT
jgi:hypothetical protein